MHISASFLFLVLASLMRGAVGHGLMYIVLQIDVGVECAIQMCSPASLPLEIFIWDGSGNMPCLILRLNSFDKVLGKEHRRIAITV